MDFVFSEINGDKKRRGFVSMHIMDILLICFTSWYVATSNRLKCTCSHFMHVLDIYVCVCVCKQNMHASYEQHFLQGYGLGFCEAYPH